MKPGWAIAGVAAAWAPAALAQTSPAPSPPAQPALAAGKTVQGVTVQAVRPNVQRQIDRKSYNLATDQQAATGTLADVLRNIPGLDVDPQGQLSLRGEANVTILVDGQPSPLFQGPARAQLLQQLPANTYERVEVITNPSAAFRPEGSGGIINLVTKKRAKPGEEGGVSVKSTSTDGLGGNAHAVYVTPKITLSVTLFASRGRREVGNLASRQLLDPASGETADIALNSRQVSPFGSWGFTGGGIYQLDKTTRLLGDITYVATSANSFTDTSYRSSALSGVLAQDFNSSEATRIAAPIVNASTSLVRTYKGDDHTLTFRVGYSSYSYSEADQTLFDYQLPVQPDLFQDLGSDVAHHQLDLKAEYKAPLSATARLDIGYDGELTWDSSDNQDRLGTSAATAVVVPALGHAFGFDQSVQALFATYQTSVGRLTVMPGVRLEEVSLDIADAGAGRTRRDYFEVYPTFHMTYPLTARIELSGSYSRRVQRPSGAQLDPFRVYGGPLAVSQGNPLLAPQITDSFEAEAVYTKGQSYLSADFFYRDHKDLVTGVTENLGAGVLLGTYANEGHSRTAGVELAANATLAPHVTFNLSTDLFWNQISVPVTAFEHPSSGGQVNVRPKLNWDVTPKDFLQLTLYARSRAQTLQGFTGPIVYAAGGWRHKFNDRLSMDVTAIDPFNTLRLRNVIQTPALTETDDLSLHQRSFSVGLTLALGSHPRPRPRDFDFGAGTSPGAAPGGGVPGVGGPAN